MRYLINFLYKVFRFRHNIYPYFHPDRPYFVNLAHYYHLIENYFSSESYLFQKKLISLTKNYEHSANVQIHYLKYLDKFGPEEKLPGFLMTNQQMIEFIDYQNRCFKYQDGIKRKSFSLKEGNIFNCPVGKDEDDDFGWK